MRLSELTVVRRNSFDYGGADARADGSCADIGNRSSGKMGYALAEAALAMGQKSSW